MLRMHFRSELATEITSGIMNPVVKPTRRTASAAKRSGPNRQVTNDGTERSASQFIRDCGDEMGAKDVCAAASSVGLTIDPPLVYNVRAQAKKRTEKAAPVEESAKSAEDKKVKLRENAAKARAARAAKKAKAEETVTEEAVAKEVEETVEEIVVEESVKTGRKAK